MRTPSRQLRQKVAGPTVAAPRSDAERVAGELLQATGSIRRAIRRLGRRPVELSALTGAQLELARLLRGRPGISVAEAAQELGLAPNTVSTLVRQLGGAGILVRRVDPTDRRVARLDLSAAMRRKIDAWRDRRVVALGAAVASLPDADRQLLADALPLLARLAEQLEDEQADS